MIRETLLRAMNERSLLQEHEILAVLRDAAAAHRNAVGADIER
jgi:hypothetical protein